jgi:hypothetical protein
MNIKSELTTLIQAATGLVVHWDTTPEGFMPPAGGFIVAQQIGGEREWYVERDTPKSHNHARIQFVCYAKRRLDVDAIAWNVENTIRLSNLLAQPYGAPIDGYESALGLRTTLQQFGFQVPV